MQFLQSASIVRLSIYCGETSARSDCVFNTCDSLLRVQDVTKRLFRGCFNLMIIHVWRVEAGVECHSYVAVETHGGVEHAVQISESDAALWHFVHDEVQCVPV